MYVFLVCPAFDDEIPLLLLKMFQNPALTEKKSGNVVHDPQTLVVTKNYS